MYKIIAFAVYAIPMLLLFLLNMDRYKSDGSIFGFFGYVILGFVFISFKNSIISLIKTRTLMSMSAILFVFSLLMQYLADEMVLITAVSLVGSILQIAVEVVANTYEEHAYIVRDGVKMRNMRPAIPDSQAWREAYGLMAFDQEEGGVDTNGEK